MSHFGHRAAAVVMGVALAASLVTPGHADEPRTAEEARERVQELKQEQGLLEDKALTKTQEAKDARAEAKAVAGELAALERDVADARADAAAIALAQYRSQHSTGMSALWTAVDVDEFLNQVGALEQWSESQAARLRTIQALSADTAELRDQQRILAAEADAAAADADDLVAQAQDKVAQAERVVDRLEAAERQRYLAEQRQREAEARAEAARERAAAPRSENRAATEEAATEEVAADEEPERSDPPARTQPAPADPAPVSSRSSAVVAYAYAHVGSAYVFGATGPGAFDCSGFTQAAYRSAGISIPRTASAQWFSGQRVSPAQARPGDIVIYNGGGHAAIYIGNGRIIHAANPRVGVTYGYLYSSDRLMAIVRF